MANPTNPNSGEPSVVVDPPAPAGDPAPVADPPAPADGEAPAEDAPAADSEPAKVDGPPETYEFTASEGNAFDPTFITSYSDVAREAGLSQANAQLILDKVAPVLAQAQADRIAEVQASWDAATKTDKEIGGTNLDQNLGIAHAARDQFGTKEFKELLEVSGLAKHPEVIRYFLKVGKAVSGDSFVGGRKEGNGSPKDFNQIAAKMYPNSPA